MKDAFVWALILSTCFLLAFPILAIAGETSEGTGDVVQILLPGISFGLTYLEDDSVGRLQFVRSFLTSMGLTHGLKRAINRRRPNGGSFSFPAGHVSAAFASAAFLGKRYGWQVGLPAYVSAAYVGWSRIDADQHFTEDVLAGAALGIATSYYFTNDRKDAIVYLSVSAQFYGLAIEKRW